MTNLLHRLPKALAIVLVLALFSLGVIGVASADQPGSDGSLPDHLRIAERHAGDRGTLRLQSSSPAGSVDRTSSFEWLPEQLWLDGQDGTWHAAHARQGEVMPGFDTAEHVSAFAFQNWVETATGRSLGAAADTWFDARWEYGTTPVTPGVYNSHQLGRVTTWSIGPVCALDAAVRSGIELRDTVVMVDPCLGLGDEPIAFEIGEGEVEGINTVRFTAERDGQTVIVDYNEAFPERLRTEQRWTEGSSVRTLTGFEAGDLRWDTGLAVPPPVDLPPIVVAPRRPWGPDDAGVDHPFPASRAWQMALESPQFTAFRDYMQAHPDAIAHRAHYDEARYGNTTQRSWFFSVVDPGSRFALFSTLQTAPAGSKVTDLLGQPAPPLPATDEHSAMGGETDQTSGFCLGDPAEGMPTVASVMARWQATVGSADPANGWDLDCGLDGGPDFRAISMVTAGRQSLEVQAHRLQDMVQGTTRNGTGFVSALRVNGTGSPLGLETEATVQGQTYGLMAATPPLSSSVPPAEEHGFLRLSGFAWYAPSGPATGALAVSVGVGLAYWLWPLVKGGGVGLFSRIEGPRVLDHPLRRRIVDAVEAQPGVHYQAILRLVGGGKGAVEHHLRKLVDSDLLLCHQGPGYSCYFPAKTDRRLLAASGVLKADGAKRLLAMAVAKPGASSADLAAATGLDPSTVSHHVHRLADAGLLRTTKVGRLLRVDVTPLAGAALAIG